MTDFRNDEEIFEYVRNSEIPKLPPLKDLLSSYHIPSLEIDDVISKITTCREDLLIIDARSESEYRASSLPLSKSFPVLSDSERHNVGLIYKKYSQASALWLALKFAEPKSEGLDEFLKREEAHNKEIIVYCWRGGGRSGYLASMICKLGYKPSTLKGGHKAFRNSAVRFFEQKFPSHLLELSGLTGCGKTEMLRKASPLLPVIDLEQAALHYSSLLGRIPYEIKGISAVLNQSAFENSLFSQFILNGTNKDLLSDLYLIESESRKVGEFMIPSSLYSAVEDSPSVRIISSLEKRIARLKKDYFGKDNAGIVPMRDLLMRKEIFFKQQLSTEVFNELIRLLESGYTDKFIEIMLVRYYDVKYKDKGKKHLAEISADNSEEAVKEIQSIYNSVRSHIV